MQEVARDQSVMTGTPPSAQTSLSLLTTQKAVYSTFTYSVRENHTCDRQTCDRQIKPVILQTGSPYIFLLCVQGEGLAHQFLTIFLTPTESVHRS